MVGTVKWYDPAKGFGFITPEGGGRDVFVHATALERAGLGPLQERQSVRMGVVQGAKGPEVGRHQYRLTGILGVSLIPRKREGCATRARCGGGNPRPAG